MVKREKREKSYDADLDDALDQTFPASDPPSQISPVQGTKVDIECLKEGVECDILGRTSGRKKAR